MFDGDQGLFQIMEKNVSLVCRKVDVSLVESLVEESSQEYRSKLGPISVQVDAENFLADKWFVSSRCYSHPPPPLKRWRDSVNRFKRAYSVQQHSRKSPGVVM